jgi:hypothetical protein
VDDTGWVRRSQVNIIEIIEFLLNEAFNTVRRVSRGGERCGKGGKARRDFPLRRSTLRGSETGKKCRPASLEMTGVAAGADCRSEG